MGQTHCLQAGDSIGLDAEREDENTIFIVSNDASAPDLDGGGEGGSTFFNDAAAADLGGAGEGGGTVPNDVAKECL